MTGTLLKQTAYLGRYLKPHRRILILSLGLSAISTVLGMLHPYFSKILIDDVFIERNTKLLVTLLSALVVLLFISFIIRVTNSYIYTRYSANILFKMREDLYTHLQFIPIGFFSKNKIGDIFSRISSDMSDIQAFITDTVPLYLFNVITCLFTAGILFWLNWRMAILSLAFLPVAMVIITKLRPRLLDLGQQVAENNADIAHFLFESLSNTSLIRAYGVERLETDRLNKKHSRILHVILRYQILGAFSGTIPTAFTIINTLIVFGYGGFLVLDGSLSIGTLVAFSVYQAKVFGPLQGILDGFLSIQKTKVALKRVRDILDIQPEFEQRTDMIIPGQFHQKDICFKNVSYSYESGKPLLRDISFTIPHGKTTAIIGPSGVGKTTICHLILNLFSTENGSVTWGGVSLDQFNREWLRKQIAIVSQDTFLFHTTIMENIKFSKPEASNAEAVAAAKAASIHAFIDGLPEGYQTVIGDRGTTLSGGQRQRISIARAILTQPQILILDEATAFLDRKAACQISETIKSLMNGKIIIVVSHQHVAVRHAENMVVLDENGITYDGPTGGCSHAA